MTHSHSTRLKAAGASLAMAGAVALATPAQAFDVGPLSIGGAIRANYVYGDYTPDGTGAAQRGDNGGNFSLDVFRINLDYEQGPIVGKGEYRWYDGYNFVHTAWLGYNVDETSQVQLGINRVPFGPTAYGISQSWFFDQHYYVGLADDMDLGAKYSTKVGEASLDLAYYVMAQPNGVGVTDHAARYDRDMVENDDGEGYSEENQVNLRVIQPIQLSESVTTDLGVSLQYGQLKNEGNVDDGEDADAYAGSIHAINQIDNIKLALQFTAYDYGIEGSDLVNSGFFDYYQTIASSATVPGVSLSYYLETPDVDFLDYVIPYVEYSSVMKDGQTADGVDFEDSDLITLGAAWGSGGWYIYTETAWSDGNGFVGGEQYTHVGDNLNSTTQYRFNINFGYYF